VAGHYVNLVSSGNVGRVTRLFTDAIAVSFVSNPMRNPTKAELQRRFDICDRVFGVLRADLQWSLQRIEDMLPTYLKCELDGVPYRPEDIGLRWGPEAAIAMHDCATAPEVVVVDAHGMPISESELASLDARLRGGDNVVAAGAPGQETHDQSQ
jgi:hypothetical protein